jgi:hypothetical protein
VFVLVDVAVGRPVEPVWPFRRRWGSGPGRRGSVLAGLAAAGITVACCSSVIWYFQRNEGLTHVGGVLGTLGENAFVLIMLALVALLPARARAAAVPDPTPAGAAVPAAE